MVKSKTHSKRIPRGQRGDGRKTALKEKRTPARKRDNEKVRNEDRREPQSR